MVLARSLVGLSLAAVAAVACSAGPSETTDLGAAAATTNGAVPLQGDIARCPGKYRTERPVAGRNGDFVVADQSREFFLMLPPGDPAAPHPLLVAFNGTGDNGAGMISAGHLEDFVARGFIVVAPSSIGNGTVWPVWDALRQPGTENDPNKDLDYFDTLVQCVAAHNVVDKDRVYVGGHSAGGIMTNYVLQRRSSLLAGGIVASGIFSLTSPVPPPVLDPMLVIVTWGGNNDEFQGNGTHFDFVNEASLSSKHYDSAPNVTAVNCHGADLGHTWLWHNNPYLIDLLLAHPKGHATLDGPLPEVPQNALASCADTPFEGRPLPQVECPASHDDGCQQLCQFVGDCAVENQTIQPVLNDQLVALGFSGDGNTQCGGCVDFCDAHGNGADPVVLACFKKRQATAQCGQGIEGVVPLVDAVNDCCQGHADSPLCVDICTTLLTQPQAGGFFPTCTEITGQ
jgi:poly(3-hydroxybutyrate) depolymerase